MNESGEAIAGSSRSYRLDPHSLPLCGEPPAGPCESFYLDATRAVVRHATANGPRITTVPISAYTGVSVRIDPEIDPAQLLIELAHDDKSLNIPLARSEVPEDIADDWQAWARVFSLPLVVEMPDGSVTRYDNDEPETPSVPRRRPQYATNRPQFLARRPVGRSGNVIHVDFREIIART